MAHRGIHVIRDDDRWWVVPEGDIVPTSSHPTLREAVRQGRALAQQQRAEFTLYDPAGRVRQWEDFHEAS